MGQMCNALKAAERAKAAEQESWAAKEKANLLEAYEKCRQGLERAVRKLKEEKEKQTAMEERRRAARGKRKLKGCRPPPPTWKSPPGGLPLQRWGRLIPCPPGGRPPPAAPAAVEGRQERPLSLS